LQVKETFWLLEVELQHGLSAVEVAHADTPKIGSP
jgi:hypothetical protein